MPKFDKGFLLSLKLTFSIFEIPHASGNKMPVQIKTNKFLVKIGTADE